MGQNLVQKKKVCLFFSKWKELFLQKFHKFKAFRLFHFSLVHTEELNRTGNIHHPPLPGTPSSESSTENENLDDDGAQLFCDFEDEESNKDAIGDEKDDA